MELFKAKSNLCLDGLFFCDNDANRISPEMDFFLCLLHLILSFCFARSLCQIWKNFCKSSGTFTSGTPLMYLLVATILAWISLSSHNRYLWQDIFFSYIQLDVIFKHFFSQCFLILFLSWNFLFSYPFAFWHHQCFQQMKMGFLILILSAHTKFTYRRLY